MLRIRKLESNIDGSNVNCVEMLSRLINLQWDRVVMLVEKEKDLHVYIAVLNKEIKLCEDLLLALQKVRFDLGLDEYKRSTPARKANADSRPSPEEDQRQIYAAYAAAAKIFEKRGINASVASTPSETQMC